jgi:expansin (peptidoglycan-binding protein)
MMICMPVTCPFVCHSPAHFLHRSSDGLCAATSTVTGQVWGDISLCAATSTVTGQVGGYICLDSSRNFFKTFYKSHN